MDRTTTGSIRQPGTRSTSTTTGTLDGYHLSVQVQDDCLEPEHVLYNTGPITFQNDPDLNVKQTYTIEKITRIGSREETSTSQVLRVAPPNIGPRSNPVYNLTKGVTNLGGNRLVFAGPRDDPFFVDLGSIFDLGGLRPLNPFHVIKPPASSEAGVDGVLNYNTHTIALQVPKTDLVQAPNANGVIGIYASASRQKIRVLGGDGTVDSNGPWVQVSRLGNPLINEVVIPIGQKDYWNASPRRMTTSSSRATARRSWQR